VVSDEEVRVAVDQAHRSEWGLVLAATARLAGGDLDVAEDATSEAFIAALETWGSRGIPDKPGAWLTATARRKALDRLRRASTLRSKLPLLIGSEVDADVADMDDFGAIPDDRLRLVFTCCHPALAPEARIALTLRLVCGLTTPEIARAFLVPEPTMAARITRAKKKISGAKIPYLVPASEDLPERLDTVLTVVHLVFTAGHTAAVGDELVRQDLVARALDLARVLATLLPEEPEVLGLLALLELSDARRRARVDAAGHLVLLQDQDRSLWDAREIDHGSAMFDRALVALDGRRPGRFVLQAGITAVHSEAPSWEATDWPAILALYDRLLAVWPSPVVEVNRAVALSFVAGPERGLQVLDDLCADERLAGYHYLPAARADLLRRLGRTDEAARAYRAALDLQPAPAESEFLERQLAALQQINPE
jgi:RNA polymerase sigma-70 factor (ECF subfamily)